jgi:hypothetical protein
VRNQPHCFVGVAIEWQLDDSNHFLLSRISQVLILVLVLRVVRVQDE